MRKRTIRNLESAILGLSLLAACSAPSQHTLSVSTTISESTLVVPSATITGTQVIIFDTPTPTHTPAPAAIPTATPTLDVSSIITHTPAPPQDCPAPANVSLPDLSIDSDNYSFVFSPREEKVLDYLNQGGNPSNLIAYLRQTWGDDGMYRKNEAIKDLTGDGVPEILIMPSELYILGCKDHEYQILKTELNASVSMNFIGLQLVGLQDMNLNNTPEIVLANFGCGGMGAGQCLDVYVYEWDGNKFISLFPQWKGYDVGVSMIGGRLSDYLPDVRIQDTDHNGTQELILAGDIPSSWYDEYYSAAPWRDRIDTYTWNEQYFILQKTEFSAPVYRFQAVQDGDRAMSYHEYDKALTFYQAAIFDTSLLGWSQEHKTRSKELSHFTWDPAYQGTATPVNPPDDPQEYPNLAAYARYRIMLIHILQGNMPEAQIVHETLQEKFPEGSDGHGFALVAKAFWDEYQRSQNLKASCDQAVSTAATYESILRFLGGDYHNFMQDITYLPKNVCPFE